VAKLISLLTLAFLSLYSTPGFTESTRLELLVKSESKVAGLIGLKQLISNQHKNISIEDLEIDRIVVEAKSKGGQGIISVIVGSFEGTPLRVPANPDFTSPNESTFFSLELDLPAQALAAQSWQLKTQGNVKVNRVLVYVTTKNHRFPNPSRVTYHSVEKFRLEKFIETTKTIRLNTRRGVRIVSLFVRAISPNLIGSRADLEVQTGL
jgi:hypothetical protein